MNKSSDYFYKICISSLGIQIVPNNYQLIVCSLCKFPCAFTHYTKRKKKKQIYLVNMLKATKNFFQLHIQINTTTFTQCLVVHLLEKCKQYKQVHFLTLFLKCNMCFIIVFYLFIFFTPLNCACCVCCLYILYFLSCSFCRI